MSAKELRAELRGLRKEFIKPVSKLPVKDVSAEIEMLKARRNETPAIASVPSVAPRAMKSTTESIKEAKKNEFPVAPEGSSSAKKAEVRKPVRRTPGPKNRMAEYKREFEHKVKVEEAKPSAEEKKMATKVKREMKKMTEMKEEPKAERKGRPAKGSEEAKAHMARIRSMKGKKKD